MEVNILSERTFSVYITKEELLFRGLSPDDMDISEAVSLLREALGGRIDGAQVELFSGGGDIMLFVESPCDSAVFYSFPDIEPLIMASESVPLLPSKLWFADGKYILAVFSDAQTALSEFGESMDAPPEFLDFLNEHGRVIILRNAILQLREAFCG